LCQHLLIINFVIFQHTAYTGHTEEHSVQTIWSEKG